MVCLPSHLFPKPKLPKYIQVKHDKSHWVLGIFAWNRPTLRKAYMEISLPATNHPSILGDLFCWVWGRVFLYLPGYHSRILDFCLTIRSIRIFLHPQSCGQKQPRKRTNDCFKLRRKMILTNLTGHSAFVRLWAGRFSWIQGSVFRMSQSFKGIFTIAFL